jgi:hypothetical protein
MKKLQTNENLTSSQLKNTKGGKRTATVSYGEATLIMLTHPFSAKVVGKSKDGICIEW